MSAIPGSIALPEVPGPLEEHERDGKPPFKASLYFFVIAVVAAVASIPLVTQLRADTPGWATFLVLGSTAAVAQLFVVRTPRNQAYHTTVVFLIPAVMLLPPELVALLGLIQHIPEWLKNRNAWYSQTFNICSWTLSLLATWASFHAILGADHLISNGDLRVALAGIAAAAVFVAINHLLLAPMLHFFYSHSFRELGIFSFESLSTDLVLAALGVGVGVFWVLNPWLLPIAVAPLLLIHRSLSVPQLQEEARVDPKTGLFNARYFAAALAEELARSQRFERPLTLVMADLDLLRDINNNYGHLAGDAVLKSIAETFRTHLRHYDVPARFGGEEFAILLPETPPEQAFEIAERIRREVAATRIDVETSSEPISATVSIGVAGFPRDGADANELIHQADLAVYRAKLQGRNRVLDASSEPLVVPEARTTPLVAVPDEGEYQAPLASQVDNHHAEERRHPRPHAVHGPTFFSLSKRLAAVVGLVGLVGTAAGVASLVFGTSHDITGMIAIVALVGAGQALALELDLGSPLSERLPARRCSAPAQHSPWRSRPRLSSGARGASRCTTSSSTSARSRSPRLQRSVRSRCTRSTSMAIWAGSSPWWRASAPGSPTSPSTWASSASRRRWKDTNDGGGPSRSASRGSFRITSSTGSSPASSTSATSPRTSGRLRSSRCRSS